MAQSIALAADASRLASLLLSYIKGVCAFVAPRHPGASTAIIDRLSHSRALTDGGLAINERGNAPRPPCRAGVAAAKTRVLPGCPVSNLTGMRARFLAAHP